ncbi:MAG: DUF881 domain-containing protein [Corynebacteriales bacterium]|nr:DUF881 domain-containing protein [Mycobacteriales bacterium]
MAHRAWRLAMPVMVCCAGFLLATTATTAGGTELRSARRVDLSALIGERGSQVARAEQERAERQAEIERATRRYARSDTRVEQYQDRIDELADPTGLQEVTGPSLTVTLNDAPRAEGGQLPAGARPDDVVVHQQDVQAVVNSLWAGGADAMTIMGERVINTSAVRCVGNTLLIHGRTFSPPFTVVAIGDQAKMQAALQNDPGVKLFQQAARSYGLEYHATVGPDVTLPAYQGSTTLRHATPTTP